MGTQDHGALGAEEEMEILFRNGQVPAGTTLSEIHRGFRRRWKTWVLRLGWVPLQEVEDIISDAQAKVYELLGDRRVPIEVAAVAFRRALNCFRMSTARRFEVARDSLTMEEFEIAADFCLETEPQRRSNREQEVGELKLDVLELLRKTWPYLELALDCLSNRDKTVFHEVYGFGHLPSQVEDLASLSRNNYNVILHRARERFLEALQEIVSNALPQVAEEDRLVLQVLLEMIENGSFKHLLALRRQER